MDVIDNYCERIDASFWSEPLNAITNVGFILVGLFALHLLKKQSNPPRYLFLLAFNAICIGIGSFLYHTFANTWSKYVDIFPIYLFQVLFVWCYCRYVLTLPIRYIAAIFLMYIGATLLTQTLTFEINGSEMYLPTIITILALGFAHRCLNNEMDKALVLAGCLFALSLFFRTIDEWVCPHISIGTHFLWHSVNALVVFYCWLALKNNTCR